MALIEPAASAVPLLVSVGNHEYDYMGASSRDPSGAGAICRGGRGTEVCSRAGGVSTDTLRLPAHMCPLERVHIPPQPTSSTYSSGRPPVSSGSAHLN